MNALGFWSALDRLFPFSAGALAASGGAVMAVDSTPYTIAWIVAVVLVVGMTEYAKRYVAREQANRKGY